MTPNDTALADNSVVFVDEPEKGNGMQLHGAERSYLKLVRRPETDCALDLLAAEKGVKFRKSRHRDIFLGRTYASRKALELALLRYKVFGDLGYGDEVSV